MDCPATVLLWTNPDFQITRGLTKMLISNSVYHNLNISEIKSLKKNQLLKISNYWKTCFVSSLQMVLQIAQPLSLTCPSSASGSRGRGNCTGPPGGEVRKVPHSGRGRPINFGGRQYLSHKAGCFCAFSSFVSAPRITPP